LEFFVATLIDAFPLISTLRDAVFLSATVSEIEKLTPRMRRIRFSGPRLQGLTWTPGQHVRLQVESLRESVLRLHPYPVLRTYSIYNADPDLGTLDIVMVDHDGDPKAATPARRWATATSIGDHAHITRPQGKLVIRHDAPYHVFAGEETASVAFAAMLRSMHPTAEVYGVIEAATDTDHLPLAPPLTRVERGDAPAANSAVLADALRSLPLPDYPGIAYLAGEARTIQTLRKILITERGWDRRQIRTKPFWTPGRTGME
jgi:NADPH-dependent ferric siderophore reductase